MKRGSVARVGILYFFWLWLEEDGDFDGEGDEADDVGEDAKYMDSVGESLCWWCVEDDAVEAADDIFVSEALDKTGLSFNRLRYSSRLT